METYELHKRLEEYGIEKPDQMSNCLKKGMQHPWIKFDDSKEDALATVVYKGEFFFTTLCLRTCVLKFFLFFGCKRNMSYGL